MVKISKIGKSTGRNKAAHERALARRSHDMSAFAWDMGPTFEKEGTVHLWGGPKKKRRVP